MQIIQRHLKCIKYQDQESNIKRKWNHGDDMFQYAIDASACLNNFMMNTENLSYAATAFAENIFKTHY